jgi:hypothetical protein
MQGDDAQEPMMTLGALFCFRPCKQPKDALLQSLTNTKVPLHHNRNRQVGAAYIVKWMQHYHA